MTYAVLIKTESAAIWHLVSGNMAHMSSADTIAHGRFVQDRGTSSIRVVNSDDHSVIYYELSPDTHFVDAGGQVRPLQSAPTPVAAFDILAVPAGAKPTGAGRMIDLTPTWKAVLPLLILTMTEGTDDAKRIAKEELQRMAEAADRWNSANR